MCITYIIRWCNRCNIAAGICHMHPCRCQCRKTFGLCDLLCHSLISILICYIMPCHINGVILWNAWIVLLIEFSCPVLLLFILQSIVLNISDHTFFCADLLPVFFTFDDCYFIFFLEFCQYRALYSTLITHLCILLYSCHIRFAPFGSDHYMIRIIWHFIINIRVLLDKIQRDICCVSFCF